jgi:hypothetical protein
MRPLAGGGVDVHPRDPRRGEGFPTVRSTCSVPTPRKLRSFSAASGAALGLRLVVEAVVAGQPAAAPVVRERHVARGAVPHLAALAALHEGRIAAAVQEQDALLAAPEPLGDRALQLRDRISGRRPCSGPVSARSRLRSARRSTTRTAGSGRPPRGPGARAAGTCRTPHVVPALQRRGGGAEHTERAFHPGPYRGDLARVVARRLALLVRALVLLVDDDRAQVRERREDGGARADHDALLPAPERPPLVVPLAVAERGVEHGHAVAEDGLEAPDRLRRQRDLGHEHDRGTALHLHHLAEQFDVDQRLAGAGDAAQQPGAGIGEARRGDQRVDGRRLRGESG